MWKYMTIFTLVTVLCFNILSASAAPSLNDALGSPVLDVQDAGHINTPERIQEVTQGILESVEGIEEISFDFEVKNLHDMGMFTIVGYCNCIKCCGIWSAQHPSRQDTDYVQMTASGTIPTEGITVAADWSVFPPGTVIEIDGIGRRIVEDKGGAVKGNMLDLYFSSHEEAVAHAKQEMRVWRVY